MHILPSVLVLSSLALFSTLISPSFARKQPNSTLSDFFNSMPISGSLSKSSDPSANLYRPVQASLDVERYPVAPDGLELEQVHVYLRHGERSPVGVRLADPPANVPSHWILCKAAKTFRSTVAGMLNGEQISESMQARRLVERGDGTTVDGECLLGELTDIGRKSTLAYGMALRNLYINRLGLLPDTFPTEGQTYFRSTNIPRTVESLNQIINGIYPAHKCHEDHLPTVIVRNPKDENLLGNTFACKRLEILQIGFAQAAAATYNHTLEPLDKKLSKYLNGNPIRVDGKPRASGILDTVRAAIAHNITVPPEFEDKSIVDVIEKAVVNEWFSGYKTEEVRRLGMGRLFDDLMRKIQHKIDSGSKDPLKLLVHSTHDTALAAICSTLDVYDEKWPAFTASVTFELFKKQTQVPQTSIFQTVMSPFRSSPPPPEHYVRMRYQNKNMALPMCAEDGKHLPGSPEFCALSVFRDRVRELVPLDWEAECLPAGRSG